MAIGKTIIGRNCQIACGLYVARFSTMMVFPVHMRRKKAPTNNTHSNNNNTSKTKPFTDNAILVLTAAEVEQQGLALLKIDAKVQSRWGAKERC